MAESGFSDLGSALNSLCGGVRQALLVASLAEIALFLVFAAAAYFAYKKYSAAREPAYVIATVLAAAISVWALAAGAGGLLLYFQGQSC